LASTRIRVVDGGSLFVFPLRSQDVVSADVVPAPREKRSNACLRFFAVPMTALGIASVAHGARE
jgi:hypothetical protein